MIDVVGQKFGKLTVLKFYDKNKRGEVLWQCECECGNLHNVVSYRLRKGQTKSCGCLVTGSIRNDDLVGTKVNQIKILKYSHTDQYRDSWYQYQCDCGFVGRIRKKQIGKTISCSKCSYKRKEKHFEDLGTWYIWSLKASAKFRNIEFDEDLTSEYLWRIYESQDGLCAYTGKPIILKRNIEDRKLQTASLDRIDSSKKYSKGNVHWVDRHVNYMKQDIPHEMFLEICTDVCNYSKIKENQCQSLK